MQYRTRSMPFTKLRLLISGLSQSGKTTSLPTFIYGSHDHTDPEQHDAAMTYAADRRMVIIECPGETGHRSLPEDTPHITSLYPENEDGEDSQSAQYSHDALSLFWSAFTQAEKDAVDIIAVDGAHGLYDHMFNDITNGEWLAGLDMNMAQNGNRDPYRSARFYNQAHRTFNQYLARFYNSNIQTIIVTSWEEWQGSKNDSDKAGGIDAQRYLWPAFPGSMSIVSPGKFDARLSARREARCIHGTCEHSKAAEQHYVWQFLPRGDVMGVGIKGLKIKKEMQQRPYIHQSWHALKGLMERYT